MTAHRWIFPARVVRVYDGDTLTLSVDLGFRVAIQITGRLDGIDTPEVRGPSRPDGLLARDWVREQLAAAADVRIATRPPSGRQTGKYGRWLITVWIDGENLNERLVEVGHAVRRTY